MTDEPKRHDDEDAGAEAETAEVGPDDRARTKPPRVTAFYQKSPSFRTIHVDGIFGGPSPQGLIQMGLFSERLAIPTEIDYGVTTEGILGSEVGRRGKRGIVRELEINAMMTTEIAQSLRDWLDRHLKFLQKLKDEQGA